ncbi:MAG: ATP-binding protein, partial [Prevotella sp.]|nr:ATP-binding protein [Prevotella sp.]
MRVKLSKAVKMFFGNSSLEMVYFEAIANALDAGATQVDIVIFAKDYSQPETLTIKISDNGVGFTDERFGKFSNLFDVDDTTHKGLGRLVYLCYFEKTFISSNYNDYFCRTFEFSDAFDDKSEITENKDKNKNGTKLSMSGYTLGRLRQYNYLQPPYLKNKFLEKFYSRFFKFKQAKQAIEISITATIDGKTSTAVLSTTEIPDFKFIKVEHSLDFFSSVELYYHIEEVPHEVSSAITAISVDNRTYPIDIIASENFPVGYKMVFLLFSDYFNGQVDAARETINMPELEKVKKLFRSEIAQIIDKEVPQITQRNQERKQHLINRFPHLNGYFEIDGIGYTSEEDLLKKAQEQFFRAQRKILGASHLTEEQFKESLELSSRALTEYIMFRQITIDKLKSFDKNKSEYDIHNLIVPRREQFEGSNLQNDLYRNNVWILDDKYMTYDTVLSEADMSKVINVITEGEVVEKDDDRPDIALIFSGNPDDVKEDKKVDVVIVELKKKGLSTELNSIVEIQLENRARKLMQYYKNKIQQIWFYGIVEFNEEYELHLEADYHRLYSKGKVYYRNKEVVLQRNPRISLPIGIFIMDFEAVVDDA